MEFACRLKKKGGGREGGGTFKGDYFMHCGFFYELEIRKRRKL